MNEAKDPARARELAITVALYNAATDYAEYVNSKRCDYDEAMKLSSRLEDAAVSYAELAGDRQPTMPKTPAISTLASSNGSVAAVEIKFVKEKLAWHLGAVQAQPENWRIYPSAEQMVTLITCLQKAEQHLPPNAKLSDSASTTQDSNRSQKI